MYRELISNLKKIMALLLTVSMLLGMDTIYCAINVYAQEIGPDDIQDEIIESDESETVTIDGEESVEDNGFTKYDCCYALDKNDPCKYFVNLDYHKVDKDLAWYIILSCAYGKWEQNAAFQCMDRRMHGASGIAEEVCEEWFGVIEDSELAKIKELNFSYYDNEEISDPRYHAAWNTMQFSNLSYFSNLEKLTIDGAYLKKKKKLERLDLPSSLKSLTIVNCEIDIRDSQGDISGLDISGCPNLMNLEIKNCDFKNDGYSVYNDLNLKGLYEIKGISSTVHNLQNLKSITMSGVNIGSVVLNEEASSEVFVNAAKCLDLKKFDVGGYKLIGDTSFEGCTELNYLNAKGIVKTSSATLNIKQCEKLTEFFHVDYSFVNADYRLKISAKGIPAEQCADFEVKRSGTVDGKYVLEAIDTSYLYVDVKERFATLFDGMTIVSNNAEYLCFAQDVEKFEKEAKTTIDESTGKEKLIPSQRDYKSRPILLQVGQKLENNRVYAYTEDLI